jgi:molecular chaperone GrpE
MARKKNQAETEAGKAQGEAPTFTEPKGPAPSSCAVHPPAPQERAPASPAPPEAVPAVVLGAPSGKDGAVPSNELEEARCKLTEARARADGNLALLQRVAADYENYKKFSERERGEAVLRERAAILSDFLESYENLERALEAGKKELPVNSGLMKGLRLTLETMKGTLERAGVRPIEAVGKQFDPSLHEAVYFLADPSRPEYSVVEEVRRGYTINGKVLRTSKVCVATRPAPAGPQKKESELECPKEDDREE